MSGPRWAVTLFSFTNELLEASRTPDELLADVLGDGGSAGEGATVEIDAAQHFRSFPELDPDEVEATASVVRSSAGSVSVLGGGADLFPAPGVVLDDAATLEQLRAQITAARILGAEGLRIPFGVLPWPLLHRAADLADTAGIVLLEEVQGPQIPDDPRLTERIADLDRSGVTGARLLVDVSALMGDLPRSYVAALLANGVPDDVVARVQAGFASGRVAPEVVPHLHDDSLSPAAKSLLVTAMTRFGHGRAADWLTLAPWIGGVHLKYWDLDQAEWDLAGETGEFVAGLFAAGFSGTVCSEWGGHEWAHLSTGAATMTSAHRALFDDRFPDFAPIGERAAG